MAITILSVVEREVDRSAMLAQFSDLTLLGMASSSHKHPSSRQRCSYDIAIGNLIAARVMRSGGAHFFW
jgi:hypothetical protein